VTVRVLLADDDVVFRDALARRLVADGDTAVTTAGNGDEAVEQYRKVAPDVVLMDVVMPICDGVDATRRILELDPDARIVAITSGDDHRALALCLAAGALGCVKKRSDTMTLAPMLLALAAKRGSDAPCDPGQALHPC
jgi:two-component system chemotaxis response regulator CheY